MKFISLSFENFMSFQKRQVLPLADQGLVLVQGDNQLSGAADSNGVGKTAIFDALSWVLFGQTLRGLKADDVACRFNKGQCAAGVLLEIDGVQWVIKRTRRPALLELKSRDGSSVAEAGRIQEAIDALLGFGVRTFKNAVIFGQGNFERFATASQDDQMKMLDEVQNVDFVDSLLRAKDWRGKGLDRLSHMDVEAAAMRSQQEAAQEQIRSLTEAKEKFSTVKAAELRTETEGMQESRERLMQQEAKLTEISASSQRVHQVVSELQNIDAMKEGLKETENELKLARNDVTHANERRDNVKKKVKELVDAGRCPTCRVAMKGESRKEMERGFGQDVKQEEASATAAERRTFQIETDYHQKRDKISIAVQNFKLKYEHVSIDRKELDRMAEETSSAVVQREEKLLAEIQRDIEARETRIEQIRTRKWEGDAPFEAAKKQLEEATEKLVDFETEKKFVAEAIAIADYWIEAFGNRGLRSLMFDSVAAFLNERIAYHLEVLTSGEASVSFSALSALKRGGMKEKLSVATSWVWGAGNYTAGSAGQDRRIDLAIFGAIQDLAERRSARPFPIKVWDEAGDSLDYKGKETFAEWVSREARTRGTGFVITHDREFGDIVEPDRVWTVRLNKTGGAEVITDG